MKTTTQNLLLVLGLLSTLSSQLSTLFAQGTAFTYQGRLNDGTTPANGRYDLRFALYDAASAGTQQGNVLTNSATVVNNGLFTVTLDFGSQLPGANRWLQLAVRTNGAVSFSTLTPRQPLTPAPYAITAGSVVSGGLASGTYGNAVTLNNASNSFTGAFTGNGANVTNVSAATLGGIRSSGFWKTNGNAAANPTNGAFLGTSDSLPLEFKVNGTRALRLEPTSYDADHSDLVNVIGGSSANAIAPGVYGSVIAGGGAVNWFGFVSSNTVAAHMAFLGGGVGNSIQGGADGSCLAGGYFNSIQARANGSFLGSGHDNSIQPSVLYSFLGGGEGNSIQVIANCSFLGSGAANSIQPNAPYSFLGGGIGNSIQTNASRSFLGGGDANSIQTNASSSFLGGGSGNSIQAYSSRSFLGGGIGNFIQPYASSSFLGGGYYNSIQTDAFLSFLGGGGNNTVTANGSYATIPGGLYNVATSYAFAAGSYAQATNQGAFVWSDISSSAPFPSKVNNEFAVRAAGGARFQSSYLQISGAGNEQAYIGGDGNGGDVEIGSRNAAIMNVGFWNAAAYSHMNVYALSFVPMSDRNAKTNFAAVDPQEVLDKVAALPISAWNYKTDVATRHLGPMAQDFHAAFGIGPDDKHIATVDADGVALAAIQGLNQKVEGENRQLRGELAQKQTEITELEKRLEALEKILLGKKAH